MTLKEVMNACEHIAEKIRERHPNAQPVLNGRPHNHVLYMAGEVLIMYRRGQIEKAMRWLGFAQGYLWSCDYAAIAEMKDINRG